MSTLKLATLSVGPVWVNRQKRELVNEAKDWEVLREFVDNAMDDARDNLGDEDARDNILSKILEAKFEEYEYGLKTTFLLTEEELEWLKTEQFDGVLSSPSDTIKTIRFNVDKPKSTKDRLVFDWHLDIEGNE